VVKALCVYRGNGLEALLDLYKEVDSRRWHLVNNTGRICVEIESSEISR
jgi:hypothetical protein